MPSRNAVVANPHGLHARPAARFVTAAAGQPVPVTIRRPGGEPVRAASILAVMTLGISCGDEVVLEADGEGAQAAVDALADLLESDDESDPESDQDG
jgi:phosphocarrier protein HPr